MRQRGGASLFAQTLLLPTQTNRPQARLTSSRAPARTRDVRSSHPSRTAPRTGQFLRSRQSDGPIWPCLIVVVAALATFLRVSRPLHDVPLREFGPPGEGRPADGLRRLGGRDDRADLGIGCCRWRWRPASREKKAANCRTGQPARGWGPLADIAGNAYSVDGARAPAIRESSFVCVFDAGPPNPSRASSGRRRTVRRRAASRNSRGGRRPGLASQPRLSSQVLAETCGRSIRAGGAATGGRRPERLLRPGPRPAAPPASIPKRSRREVWIDGYNLLTTVEAALAGRGGACGARRGDARHGQHARELPQGDGDQAGAGMHRPHARRPALPAAAGLWTNRFRTAGV